MENSVLAEQRREMVINLLKGMKIKKTDGDGFDRDDVYMCMQQLCDVYEKSIDDLTNNYEEQIAELQDKYQKYDENNDLYISLIMEAKKSSNEIITKAKGEVDEILTSGKEQIAKQEEEIEFARKAAEQERADLKAGMDKAREDAERSKAALAEEVEAEKIRAEEARTEYRRRIEAMEQEFEEIKTNILRTAGKIDGLKSQINDPGDELDWDIREAVTSVDVPEPDISVEESFEADEDIKKDTVAPVAAAPIVEEAAVPEEIVTPAEEPAADEEYEELTFDDLVSKLQSEEPAEAESVQDDAPVEIELPDINDEIGIETAEPALDAAAVEDEIHAGSDEEEKPIDEISFEGLEELFKE